MSYVPIVTPPHVPSHQTRELADQLARVIVDFEQNHPAMSSGEIREAAQLALQASQRGGGIGPALVFAAAGMAVLVVGGTVFAGVTGVFSAAALRWVGIGLIASLGVLTALVALLRGGKL